MEVTDELTPRDILQYWKHLYGHSGPFATQYWLGVLVVVASGLPITYRRQSGQMNPAVLVGLTPVIALAYVVVNRFGLMSSLSGRSPGLNSFSSFARRSDASGASRKLSSGFGLQPTATQGATKWERVLTL